MRLAQTGWMHSSSGGGGSVTEKGWNAGPREGKMGWRRTAGSFVHAAEYFYGNIAGPFVFRLSGREQSIDIRSIREPTARIRVWIGGKRRVAPFPTRMKNNVAECAATAAVKSAQPPAELFFPSAVAITFVHATTWRTRFFKPFAPRELGRDFMHDAFSLSLSLSLSLSPRSGSRSNKRARDSGAREIIATGLTARSARVKKFTEWSAVFRGSRLQASLFERVRAREIIEITRER